MRRKLQPLSSHPLYPILALLGVFVGCSTAFIVAFQIHFGLGPWVIGAHIALVAGVVVVLVLAAAVLETWLFSRNAIVFLVTILGLALALLDAINWLGQSLWVEVLSVRTIVAYAPRLLPLASNANVPWFVPAVLLVAVAWVVRGAVRRFGQPLHAAVRFLVDPQGLGLFGRRRPGSWGTVLLLAHSLMLGGFYWTIKDMGRLAGEPLISLFAAPRVVAEAAEQLPEFLIQGSGSSGGNVTRQAPSPDKNWKNVVIVDVDSLRPDHLPLYGYGRDTAPAISAFAAEKPVLMARWATSACSISGCGIMAMLGSTSYSRLRPGLPLLPHLLEAVGYETFFLMSGDFSRGFPVLHNLFGDRARMFRDDWSWSESSNLDDRTVLRALDEVPRYDDRPAFFYFHLHSAHSMGTRYGPSRFSSGDIALGERVRWFFTRLGRRVFKERSSPFVNPSLVNEYDDRIVQADMVVAQVMASLAEKGYLDNSVVVVTADHGEALGEHGRYFHGEDLHGESINVPLVIRDTGFTEASEVAYARHIDIAPTIADLVGVSAPDAWEGQSLLSFSPTLSFHETTRRNSSRAVIWRTQSAAYKYIVNTGDRSAQLFELIADPGETRNRLLDADEKVVTFLRNELQTYFAPRK